MTVLGKTAGQVTWALWKAVRGLTRWLFSPHHLWNDDLVLCWRPLCCERCCFTFGVKQRSWPFAVIRDFICIKGVNPGVPAKLLLK